MKRLLIITVIILICFNSFGQFPLNTPTGNTTLNTHNVGATTFERGVVAGTYTDTTAANLVLYMKGVPFIMISTTSDNAIWFRNSAATKWIQLLPSGSPTGLGAWTTTLNTAIPTDISLNGYWGTTQNNGIGMYTNNTQRVILPAAGLTLKTVASDTTLNKPMVYNTSTKEWNYAYWFGGSSSTPTWQQTLDAGSVLNKANDITGAFAFSFTDQTSFKIVKSTIERLSITNSLTTIQGAGSTGASLQLSSTTAVLNSTQLTQLSSGNSATSQSLIDVKSDSILLSPYLGYLSIDTLANLSTQNTILGWVQGSGQGKVGYITLSGLTLSGGVLTNPNPTPGANTALSNLASVAINTSLISDANNTDDLGSNTIGWRYGYISSGIGIGSGFTTPSAALDIRAADLFLTSSSVDQRFIIGESLVSATEFYVISWNRTDNQLVFNEGGAAVSMRLEGDANANLFFADATNDRIGIGDATPASLFTVGSGDLFQVNTSGDLVKLKNVTYSWPAANAAGVLTNNGSGTLSWAAAFALTSGNGTTANGTAVDLGGSTTGAINIATVANTFDVDGTGVISLGDVSAAGNSTKQIIDDGSSQITWFANTLFKFRTGAVQMDAYGAGAATFDASGNITSVSDMRLKNLQGMYEIGLKQVMLINPIVYKWKPESRLETKHDYIGFSAQNIKDALGENAVGINKDGFLSLQDRAIMAAICNAVKELKQLNDDQQKEINQLKLKLAKQK